MTEIIYLHPELAGVIHVLVDAYRILWWAVHWAILVDGWKGLAGADDHVQLPGRLARTTSHKCFSALVYYGPLQGTGEL